MTRRRPPWTNHRHRPKNLRKKETIRRRRSADGRHGARKGPHQPAWRTHAMDPRTQGGSVCGYRLRDGSRPALAKGGQVAARGRRGDDLYERHRERLPGAICWGYVENFHRLRGAMAGRNRGKAEVILVLSPRGWGLTEFFRCPCPRRSRIPARGLPAP